MPRTTDELLQALDEKDERLAAEYRMRKQNIRKERMRLMTRKRTLQRKATEKRQAKIGSIIEKTFGMRFDTPDKLNALAQFFDSKVSCCDGKPMSYGQYIAAEDIAPLAEANARLSEIKQRVMEIDETRRPVGEPEKALPLA